MTPTTYCLSVSVLIFLVLSKFFNFPKQIFFLTGFKLCVRENDFDGVLVTNDDKVLARFEEFGTFQKRNLEI